MKISLNWLSDYVDHGLDAAAVADLLTMSGLEVEDVETTGPSFDGVVVGHVLDVRPHPNADRLRVCDVDLGDGEPVQIVCGAANVAAGQKVPVATVGTTLELPSREDPAVRQPVTLKKSKIRGEVSNGMICAEDELGLGDDHSGILVLDTDAPAGRPFADYLAAHGDRQGDAVLDVNVTPNRPDATSHIGVARDVAALADAPLLLPDVAVPPEGETAVRVRIEDPEGCPRYVGLVVRGVAVEPSPDWLRERLEAVGVRSINNVVDVTNYVLHETGQPLHAFDLAKLAGPDGPGTAQIVVRRSQAGETITTLDDQERKLPEGTLLICDAERDDGPSRPVAVAGVMGGASSEVSAETTDVLLESAYFDPSSIRRAAKALSLQTDASYRFERGVDPTGQARAAARAAALLAEIVGGTMAPALVDANPLPYLPRTVTVRPSRVAAVLGTEVPEDEIVRLLTAIGFEAEDAEADTLDAFAEAAMRQEGLGAAVREATDAGLVLTVPPWRPDVEREVDAIEEVARLWGYDRLPLPTTTPVPLVPAGDTPAVRLLDSTRQQTAALGFREIVTNSLVPRATAARFANVEWTGYEATPVETLNPISQEMAALRPSLLHGLLQTAAYNQARGAMALRLMEAGHVYLRAEDGRPVEGYHEHTALGLAMSGPAARDTWDGTGRETDVYDLKGVVLHLLAGLGVEDVTETPRPEPGVAVDDPARGALTAYALYLDAGGKRLGVLGRVSDALAETYRLQTPLYAAELDWDIVAALAARPEVTHYRPISRFPVVERDLAVVVPVGQAAGPLLDAIRQAGRPLLQDVRLFDLYTGDRVAAGHKSLAFALRFAADRTLTDKEVDGRVRRIVGALERGHGAALRQ